MIENAPPGVWANDYLQKAVRACQVLCKAGIVHGNEADLEQTQFDSTQADKFWCKEEILKCISKVEEACKMRKFLSRTYDMPSYSIGLTQLLDASEQEELDNVVAASTTFERNAETPEDRAPMMVVIH